MKALSAILCMFSIASLFVLCIACNKVNTDVQDSRARVAQFSFELEDVSPGDKIIIQTVGHPEENTIVYSKDLLIGKNIVQHSTNQSSGKIVLSTYDAATGITASKPQVSFGD